MCDNLDNKHKLNLAYLGTHYDYALVRLPFFNARPACTVCVFLFFAARVAFGVEVILGAFLCGTKRPLKELHVLDAGMYTIKICSIMLMQMR